MSNSTRFLLMNRIVTYFKNLKFLYGDKTITLANKEDTCEYIIKIPLYVRLSQCINCILRDSYNIIWKIIPYSEKWYYRLLPHIGIDNWWFNKLNSKLDL